MYCLKIVQKSRIVEQPKEQVARSDRMKSIRSSLRSEKETVIFHFHPDFPHIKVGKIERLSHCQLDYVEINTFDQTAAFNEDYSTISHRGVYRKALNFAAPTAERSSTSEQGSPRVGAAFTPACPLVDCTFDDNTFCNYVTSSTTHSAANGSLKDWRIMNKSILNSLTGIPHDLSKGGFYIYAGGTSVSFLDTFILSTKLPFEIKEPSRLDFFVYQAGIKGRLQVCINTIHECALSIKGGTIDVKARRWKNYHVPLTSSAHAIHFVVDGLLDNYAIGLDHIQLLNKYGMAAQPCK